MEPLTAIWPRIHSILQPGRQMARAGSKPGPDPAQEQLAGLRDGLERLRSMPGARDIARQVAMNRIAMIKQRLEALKAMLRFASPEQAKVLAVELRNLARELASVARGIGAAASAGSSTPTAAPADSAGTGVPEQQDDAGTPASEAIQAGEAGAPAREDATAVSSGPDAAATAGDEHSLLAALKEARNLLKELVALLRSKLSRRDHGADHLLEDMQRSIRQIDRILDQGGSPDTAAVQAMAAGDDSGPAAAAPVTATASGSIIDVRA